VPADAAGELAYRLREAVENPSLKGGPPVTISAGVSEGLVGDETDWRLLYIAADEALFEAKRGGRNRVQHSLLGPKTKLVA
jgi:GGDEF domain-containing protein